MLEVGADAAALDSVLALEDCVGERADSAVVQVAIDIWDEDAMQQAAQREEGRPEREKEPFEEIIDWQEEQLKEEEKKT